MRELIRSADGTINKSDFHRGSLLVIGLMVACGLLFFSAYRLNAVMGWMTVSVAPFIGSALFFATCSIVYFWYCLFAKRFRAMGRSMLLIQAWLAGVLLFAVAKLLAYQNNTLVLSSGEIFAGADFFSIILAAFATIMFAFLLFTGWLGAEKN